MRITDILGRSKRKQKKLRNILILTTLAIISIAIALVVLFTTFMGRAGIVVVEKDDNIGIGISNSSDGELVTNLKIEPIQNASDMLESIIIFNESNFLDTDGQYFDPQRPQYIVYSFYIGNSTNSYVTVNLSTLVRQSKYNLERAMVIKFYIHNEDKTFDVGYLSYNGFHVGLVENGNNSSFDDGLNILVPGNDERRKVTVVAYINHELSNADMLNGTVNFELLIELDKGGNL